MNGKIEHTNRRMKRPQGRLQTQRGGMRLHFHVCMGREEGRKAGRQGPGAGGVRLPSVLVLLLLYMFRRLPTRFSFHALRLAASREQRRQGERETTKRKRKQMKKGEKKCQSSARSHLWVRSKGQHRGLPSALHSSPGQHRGEKGRGEPASLVECSRSQGCSQANVCIPFAEHKATCWRANAGLWAVVGYGPEASPSDPGGKQVKTLCFRCKSFKPRIFLSTPPQNRL